MGIRDTIVRLLGVLLVLFGVGVLVYSILKKKLFDSWVFYLSIAIIIIGFLIIGLILFIRIRETRQHQLKKKLKNTIVCEGCKELVVLKADHCQRCGRSVPPDITKCDNCGNYISKYTKNCPSCNHPNISFDTSGHFFAKENIESIFAFANPKPRFISDENAPLLSKV